MANRIKGITVEIGGDTTKLSKALEGVNKNIKSTQTQLKDVEKLLKDYPKTQAVLITSPTYDGVVSDVKRIAEICHVHGMPLIVDEAHGAHLGFCPYFRKAP